MKNDFRVQYPLWNIGAIFILGLIAFGSQMKINYSESSLAISLDNAHLLLIGTILFFIYVALFSKKVSQHNKMNPSKKLSLFGFKPIEFLEEDEMFQQVTQRATQKVYSFFSFALPLTVVLFLCPLPHLFYILIILLLASAQNLIYYLEIKKYTN